MHVGGRCFINHKTKDYFPEVAGLLNLSMSTLKKSKSHDSQLFSGDIHFVRENYDRKHPAGTRRSGDVPWRCTEGPKVETCRGISGDSQGTNTKIDDFMKKLFFRSNGPCITYLQKICEWICEYVNMWMIEWWICEFVNMWICEYVNERIREWIYHCTNLCTGLAFPRD